MKQSIPEKKEMYLVVGFRIDGIFDGTFQYLLYNNINITVVYCCFVTPTAAPLAILRQCIMFLKTEKIFLQLLISISCIIPITAGGCGMIVGISMLGSDSINIDSHFRYLSGLLCGIGCCFLSIVPHIERHAKTMQLLTCLVVIGGMGRFLGFVLEGIPNTGMILALVMELVITPLLCCWQWQLSRKFVDDHK